MNAQRHFQPGKLLAETRKPTLDRAYLIPYLGLAQLALGRALGCFGHLTGSVAHGVSNVVTCTRDANSIFGNNAQ